MVPKNNFKDIHNVIKQDKIQAWVRVTEQVKIQNWTRIRKEVSSGARLATSRTTRPKTVVSKKVMVCLMEVMVCLMEVMVCLMELLIQVALTRWTPSTMGWADRT